MKGLKYLYILIGISGMLMLLYAFRGECSNEYTQQSQLLETAYDSLQNAHDNLMTKYDRMSDAIPVDLHSVYGRMQRMYQQMDESYRQMRALNGRNGMKVTGIMSKHIQGHKTGEWYYQMMNIHEQLAGKHREIGQQSMAEMNKRHSDMFEEMLKMVPGMDKPTDVNFEREGDSSLLNRERLYEQHCETCHGDNGQVFESIFSPSVGSIWMAGDNSIPVRSRLCELGTMKFRLILSG